jgi:hypothetical protein
MGLRDSEQGVANASSISRALGKEGASKMRKIMSTRGRIPVVNECGDGRIERARNERVPVLKGLVSMNK